MLASVRRREEGQRIHILSAFNASAVSKEGGVYTIRGVYDAVDHKADIVSFKAGMT